MVHLRTLSLLSTVLLSFFHVLPRALAHAHDDAAEGAIEMVASVAHSGPLSSDTSSANMSASYNPPESYFAYPEFGGLMLAHIVLMTVAWFFILPIGQSFLQP